MSVAALGLYDDALGSGAGLRLCWDAGSRPLDLARWLAPADSVDEAVLARCAGPALDVGCGPGRLLAALARRDVPALGVDIAPAAVALARRSGAVVLRRSVFDRLPGEGRWQEVLLLDGNIGIGGDPDALLARVSLLLIPDGRLHAEVEMGEVDEVADVRVEDDGGRRSDLFRWARLSANALIRRAAPLGLTPVESWAAGGRHFLTLQAGNAYRSAAADGASPERERRQARAATRAAVPSATAIRTLPRLVR